jgi:hypothetical protein
LEAEECLIEHDVFTVNCQDLNLVHVEDAPGGVHQPPNSKDGCRKSLRECDAREATAACERRNQSAHLIGSWCAASRKAVLGVIDGRG